MKKLIKTILTISLIFLTSLLFSQEEKGEDNKSNSINNFFSDYKIQNWTSQEGLPGNTVNDILQDRSGYIYIGTYEGLVRFDGVQFLTINRSYDKKYNFTSTRCLFQDSKGNIWAGSNDEGAACIAPDLSCKMFTKEEGLPNNSVRCIREDKAGNIWFGTAGGVAYLEQETETIKRPEGLEENNALDMLVISLYCDTNGNTFIMGTTPGSLYKFDGERCSPYTEIKKMNSPAVSYMTQDKGGAYWFGIIPHYAIRKRGEDETLFDVGHGAQPGTLVSAITQDRVGNMWFCLDSGVAVIHGNTTEYYDSTMGLPDDHVNMVVQDIEDSIWLATDKAGVSRMSLSKFRSLPMDTTVNGIAQDIKRRVYWLACDDGVYCYDDNLKLVTNEVTTHCANIRVRDVAITKEGALLVSTYEKLGVVKFDLDGSVTSWNVADGLAGKKTRVAIESQDNKIYVGTTTGLSIIEPSTNSITNMTQADGLPSSYIMALFEDETGTIWVGTDGGGVVTLKNGVIDKKFNAADSGEEEGLAGNVVFKISEPRKGEIWICTGGGISRYKDGKFSNLTYGKGLGVSSVFQILLDYQGRAWMTSNKGLSSAKFQEMEAVADGKLSKFETQFYSRSDGFNSKGITSTSLSCKDKLGRIWFTLIDGAAIYDPTKVITIKQSPLIKVENITIDTDEQPYDGKSITLTPNNRRLIIKYTGLSFLSSEQLVFQYRLDGFDNKFSEWTHDRTVSYTNLKPGHYVFNVKTKTNDDTESPLSTNLYVTKEPHFWQLWYFWAGVALIVILIIGLIITARIKAMLRYQQKLESEVDKKTKQLQERNKDLAQEKAKSEGLLLNILPKPIADELTEAPDKTIANNFDHGAVLFADVVGFTKMSSGLKATEVVAMLNALFTRFDLRAKREGIEKIKTIGDCYMVACGLDKEADERTCCIKIINYAFGMIEDIKDYNSTSSVKIQMRIGINIGKLVAGVIGKTKFIYDIWGDTVNVASRMESSSKALRIHVSSPVFEAAKTDFEFEEPEEIEVKGKGIMKTYFVKEGQRRAVVVR